MSKIQKIKQQAEGVWGMIASILAPSLSEAMEHAGRHVPCPVHGGHDGFRLFRDFNQTGGGICNSCGSFADGVALIAWVNDAPIKEVINGIDEALNGVSPKELKQYRKAVAPCKKQSKEEQAKASKRLNAVWAESIDNAQAEAVKASYLASRGLPREMARYLSDFKFHKTLPHWSYNKANKKMEFKGKHPALVAMVRKASDGEPLTIHRTYLQASDGFKKSNDIPKTIMKPNGEWESCAIQLGVKPTSTLNLAEGIETSLAVMAMGEDHCWSALSTGNLSYFTPPKGVKKIIVWADKDANKAGENACLSLSKHLQTISPEIELVVKLPPLEIPSGSKGVDWLDYYNQQSKTKTKAA